MLDKNDLNQKNLSLIRKYIFELLVILLVIVNAYQYKENTSVRKENENALVSMSEKLIKVVENNTSTIERNNIYLQQKTNN